MHLVLQLTQTQTELVENELIKLLVHNHKMVEDAYSSENTDGGIICVQFQDRDADITIGIDKIHSTLTLIAPRHGLPHHCNGYMTKIGFFESTSTNIAKVTSFAKEVKVIHYLSRRTDIQWYTKLP